MGALIVLAMVAVLTAKVASKGNKIQFECESGWYHDTSAHRCYKRFGTGGVTQQEAFDNCVAPAGEPTSAMVDCTLDNVERVASIAKNHLGIQANPEGPGIWCPYKRFQEAPKGQSGFMDIRKDTSRYIRVYPTRTNTMGECKAQRVSSTFWRGADLKKKPAEPAQPGDKDDVRDEQCVVIRDLDAPLAGLDSYACSGYMLHSSICYKMPIGESFL